MTGTSFDRCWRTGSSSTSSTAVAGRGRVRRPRAQRQRTPRQRREQAQGGQQRLTAFQLAPFIRAAGLQGLEILLDGPAGAMAIDDVLDGSRRIDRSRREEPPLDRHGVGRRPLLADMHHVERQLWRQRARELRRTGQHHAACPNGQRGLTPGARRLPPLGIGRFAHASAPRQPHLAAHAHRQGRRHRRQQRGEGGLMLLKPSVRRDANHQVTAAAPSAPKTRQRSASRSMTYTAGALAIAAWAASTA